jgi:hypothetical protein
MNQADVDKWMRLTFVAHDRARNSGGVASIPKD